MNSDGLGLVVTVILLTALAFGMIVGFSTVVEFNVCNTLQTLNPDFNFQWVLWGGCLVQTPSGYWTHADNYRLTEISPQR